MNRMLRTVAPSQPPSPLMGTLAIMGFAAEDNLRSVAKALAAKDRNGLSPVAERNAKQPRLRAEVEEQVILEMSRPLLDVNQQRKLMLASRAASLFERMGSSTVEIAALCEQLLRDPRPSRLADSRKLIEHAVYTTDRAVTGLVEEDLEMVRAAHEEQRTATELWFRMNRELAALASSSVDAMPRLDLLTAIACRAHDMIEAAGSFATDVQAFLNATEI